MSFDTREVLIDMSIVSRFSAGSKRLRRDVSPNQRISPGRRSFFADLAATLGLTRPARVAVQPIALSTLFENHGQMTELQVAGPGQEFPPPSRPVDPTHRGGMPVGHPMGDGWRYRLVPVAITADEAEREYEKMARWSRERLGMEPPPGMRGDIFAQVA